ncbi:MAG: DUF4956 domain-containing protein [Chitinophagales bacterium]|nr:DUF4956 domain-containing protein [Chitinophagales bacterium]MCZ2392399.1 DUF4956 domain-containing protein [Chitinophagales bacterium]
MIFDFTDLLDWDNQVLFIRLLIDILASFVLVRLIYYNSHKNKDFLFTFALFNLLIFLICALLSTATIEMGFAFGLFAIFSFIRYRTVTVPIKEMGYLFASLTLGIINALAIPGKFFLIVIFCNVLVIGVTLLLDRFMNLTHENMKEVIYERIDLIVPERRDEMIADLKLRTGLPIHRVEITSINFLRDTANVFVFYYALENENRIISGGADD